MSAGWKVSKVALTVYVSPAELATLAAAADVLGHSVPAFVRGAALARAQPIELWESRVKAASAAAQKLHGHELSVVGGVGEA